MAKIFASKSPQISEREKRNTGRSRNIAAQGMVLLENDGILPLSPTIKNIALYGSGARRTIKGGTGSGDVNSRQVITVEQGLEEAGYTITTKQWLDRYDQKAERARQNYDDKLRQAFAEQGSSAVFLLLTDPYQEPEVIPVMDEDLTVNETDTAVYVLARSSGEGSDRKPVPGDYELFENEKSAIKKLAAVYRRFIIVLNIGGIIDTKFFREISGIGAILLMSQAGHAGGSALADVLSGQAFPGGRLTDTWAEHYQDYPSADTFSHMNGDLDDEYYREGIYVGYRYFDSFNITPAYPFGYGCSYTTFDIEPQTVAVDGQAVKVSVKVTNTGAQYSGREVVQIYCSAPDGILEKPYQELVAYARTGLLEPGKSERLTIAFPTRQLASYNPSDAAYIMEKGLYYIRVGNNSRQTRIAAAIHLTETVTVETLTNRCIGIDHDAGMTGQDVNGKEGMLREITAKGIVPFGYEGEQEQKDSASVIRLTAADLSNCEAVYSCHNKIIPSPAISDKIKLTEVIAGRATLDELVGQLTVAEMAELCVGTSRGGFGSESIIGAASAACPGAAGDTTSLLLEDRDIRNMILADGPAGLRLSAHFMADRDDQIIPGTSMAPLPGMEQMADAKPVIPEGASHYYQYCTAIPIATLLAQTWDPDLIREAGDIVGEEMEELGVQLWLAPGMNIHRNPLCGRNFEYYSEDPLISGISAAAITLGVQNHPGVGTTIKHFAFNNQEDNRMHNNAHLGERAIREIYLRGFEIAVKAAAPMAIMTSYNLCNGVHTANSYDLLTAVARDEWGFKGLIMTDWGTTGSIEMNPDTVFKYGCSDPAVCMKAGNDLIMPGCDEDVQGIIQAVEHDDSESPDSLTLGDLQGCARRILRIVMKSSAYPDAAPYSSGRMDNHGGIEGYIEVRKEEVKEDNVNG